MTNGLSLILEFTAGVDAEQSRTDFGHELLSNQLKTRLEGVDDLQEFEENLVNLLA